MDDPRCPAARGSARRAWTWRASRRASRTRPRRRSPRCASAWRRWRPAPRRAPRSPATPREAVAALDTIEPGDRLVVFVGKLIASKGVELLLAAWPLVLAREPRARLLIVGFGAFRRRAGGLAAQLAAGDLEAARATRGEDGRELPQLAAFLERSATTYSRRRGWRPRRVRRPARPRRARRPAARRRGDGGHRARSRRRSGWSPPRPPRAARCRWWPTTPGLGEVARTLREAVPEAARGWLSFEVGPTPCRSSPTRSRAGCRRPRTCAPRTREAIVEVTRERYSWDGVARTVIAAAQGELDDLPTV